MAFDIAPPYGPTPSHDHRGAQVWHSFSTDYTVLPATHALIHECNEPYLPFNQSIYLFQTTRSIATQLRERNRQTRTKKTDYIETNTVVNFTTTAHCHSTEHCTQNSKLLLLSINPSIIIISWSSFTDLVGMDGCVGLVTTTVSKQSAQDRYVTSENAAGYERRTDDLSGRNQRRYLLRNRVTNCISYDSGSVPLYRHLAYLKITSRIALRPHRVREMRTNAIGDPGICRSVLNAYIYQLT